MKCYEDPVVSGILQFGESCTISADVPIRLAASKDTLTLQGIEPNVKVTLVAGEGKQPCIGFYTSTGLSYGRFQLSNGVLKKIIIDELTVECIPHDENKSFTLGTYGMEYVPEVQCINGGRLICPEMNGVRVMVDNIVRYNGSTKLTGSADYYVLTEATTEESILSPVQRELIQKITNVNSEIGSQLNYRFNETGLKSLLEVLCWVVPNDVSYWAGSHSSTYYMTLRTCAILGMPYEYAMNNEFKFEMEKMNWIVSRYFSPEAKETEEFEYPVAVALVMLLVLYQTRDDANKDYRWEFAYELIPTYYYEFIKDVPHRDNVVKFMRDNIDCANITWSPEFEHFNPSDDKTALCNALVTEDENYIRQFLNA